MNATPTFLPAARDSRLWLLALALTACGIETKPILCPRWPGRTTPGPARCGNTSGTGGGGRSGAGAGGKAGSAGGWPVALRASRLKPAAAVKRARRLVAGGEAGSAGGEPACDESKSPKDEPCLVADEYAVFVASDGVMVRQGTMDAPLRPLVRGSRPRWRTKCGRVIVCAGDYAETVEITAGVSVYGGFDCGDEPWEHTASAATRVQPSAKGEALRIVDVEDAVLIEDVEFEAKDADAAGESSVAALVKGSAAVTLKGVKLTAGDGMDGADGVHAAVWSCRRRDAPDDTCAPRAKAAWRDIRRTAQRWGRPAYTCPVGI